MGEKELLLMLLSVVDDASRDLMTGYTDHEDTIADSALQALRRALRARTQTEGAE